MNGKAAGKSIVLVCITLIAFVGAVRGQVSHRPTLSARNVIVPQAGGFSVDREQGAVEVREVEVVVEIRHQVATTRMDISLRNRTGSRQEAELVVPVPEGAVIRGFAYDGARKEPTAQILPKEEAVRTYESIVARIRDPALLEFAGWNLVRSSVFPVPAGGSQKVRLTYEHILPNAGGRVDYVLPRTDSLRYSVPWKVTAEITSRSPISTVYSPSHETKVTRRGAKSVKVEVADRARTDPGAFRLSYLCGNEDVAASLFAYPDPSVGGGYFLLLAGAPPATEADEEPMKREVTLVLDRSGSMRGEKLRQVREAALQIIGGLEEGEAFNLMVYNQTVDLFAERAVLKTDRTARRAERYLESVNPLGGTNIYDALVEALRQEPRRDMLPVVIFLTDGLPTVGRTSEVAIRRLAEKANPHDRRIFTVGVGGNVNAPLLQSISSESRGTATFVLPNESVELKIARVFEQLAGPVARDLELASVTPQGHPAPGRVRQMLPSELPDLFSGDQLVVLGKYLDSEPLHFRLRGNLHGRRRTYKFSFELSRATTRNGFVPRLWASRKIGALVQQIQEAGADTALTSRPEDIRDERIRELVDEVVRLSKEFGILTEYTAFLAREGTDLSGRDEIATRAGRNFRSRALRDRSGWAGVNQSVNVQRQASQRTLNMRNSFLDRDLQNVQISTVQQVNDVALYRRGNRWIDSRVADRKQEPDRTVRFGSEQFSTLLRRLAREGRQGTMSLQGEILIEVDGEVVLVQNTR